MIVNIGVRGNFCRGRGRGSLLRSRFRLVTERSSCGEERCVTSLKTVVKETGGGGG